MTFVYSHHRYPWGQRCRLTPPTATPLGCQMLQQTQRALLMTVIAPFYTTKLNLPSMAVGLQTASPWTHWVMNSLWNLYCEYVKCCCVEKRLFSSYFQCNLSLRLSIHECECVSCLLMLAMWEMCVSDSWETLLKMMEPLIPLRKAVD